MPAFSLRTIVLLLTAWLALPNVGWGGGGITTFPRPTPPGPGPVQPPSGLALQIDTTWPEAMGYRPARMTLTPTAPNTADREITVSLRATGSYGSDAIVVSRDIDLPAGATSATATMSLLQLENWSQISIDCYEDGERINELSGSFSHNTNNNAVWSDANSPSFLLVGGEPFYGASAQRMGNPISFPTAKLTIDNLPERWVDYSGLDVVCIPHADWLELKSKRPRAMQALLAWTRAGGTLLVYKVGVDAAGKESDRAAPLAELRADLTADKATRATAVADWKPVEPRPAAAPNNTGYGGYNTGYAGFEPFQIQFNQNYSPASKETDVRALTLPVGQGRALALTAATVPAALTPAGGSGTVGDWGHAINSLDERDLTWYRRFGISLERGNSDFFSFSIPGVGLPPVTGFQVLITLFVLAIGPINFYVLRKLRRLNLLIITVPLCAVLVTVCLALYAILHDGLSTRVRVRSVTTIDQPSGSVVCWSRLSYYAGMAPSDGLRFPTDVAVLPIEPGGLSAREQRSARQISGESEQHLEGPWLPARTPTQYLTVRSRQTKAGLWMTPGKGSMRARNGLGTTVTEVIVADAEGNLFSGEKLAPDASLELMPIDAADARVAWQRLLDKEPMQTPEDMQYSGRRSNFGLRRRYYYDRYGQISGMLPQSSQNEGELERGIKPGTGALPLAPGQYMAVVERSPEVTLGLESAHEKGSLHVVRGTW